MLRGRCRRCGGRIAAFYPGIEAAALALVLWAATAVPPGLLPITGLLGWVLLALALLDWRHLWLPDVLTVPLILAGLATIAALDLARLPDHLIGAALGYGVLRLVGMIYHRLRARPGLGEGDAKLMAAAGAWISWQGLPTVLLIATLTALAVVALDAARTRRPVADQRIPFGSHLAVGLWLVWLYGPIVLDAAPL